jgi:hypothetical protein
MIYFNFQFHENKYACLSKFLAPFQMKNLLFGP